MRISTSLVGSLTISWSGGEAYLNDGNGTREPTSARSLTINLEGNNSNSTNMTSLDNTPPSFNKTEIGRDPSIYDGLYFISFSATDDISGIARYEVKEGEILTEVIENGIYVLKDQTRKTPIIITAYDQAGNKTISIYKNPGFTIFGFSFRFFIIIIIIMLIYGKIRKQRNIT